MKTILDIRFNGKLNEDITPLFNKISYQKRSDFNEFISLISRPHIKNLDWWVEGPASRNTYSSPLFHYYCSFFLLMYLTEHKDFLFDEILIDSSSFAVIIKELFTSLNIKNCKVSLESSYKSQLKRYVKKHFLIFILLFQKCFQMIVARIISPIKIPKKPLVLIDTFLMPGNVDEDRWYGVFWDNLSDAQKLETFFIPTLLLTKLKDVLPLFKEANLNVRNYIFKESFLKFEDLIFAFRHNNRIKKIIFNDIELLGFNFSKLIQYELNNNSDIKAVLESILTYRFIDRFKQKGYKVRLSIDWFEGQCLDKAWNMGFKKYFPLTKVIGYRPTESFPFYLSSYPTLFEQEAKVIPDVIAIQGRGTEITVKEFMPKLDTILIPSFKSNYVWSFERHELSQSKNKILVALPISEKHSQFIIDRVIKAVSLMSKQNYITNFIIKPHPAQSLNKVMMGFDKLPRYMSFTKEKSFKKLLSSSTLLITEASSTCLETLACGIPVIMMENQSGLTYDSIPERVSEKMYKKVRSPLQLLKAMEYFNNSNFENNKLIIAESKKVRKDYFEPITQEGINRFIDLDCK